MTRLRWLNDSTPIWLIDCHDTSRQMEFVMERSTKCTSRLITQKTRPMSSNQLSQGTSPHNTEDELLVLEYWPGMVIPDWRYASPEDVMRIDSTEQNLLLDFAHRRFHISSTSNTIDHGDRSPGLGPCALTYLLILMQRPGKHFSSYMFTQIVPDCYGLQDNISRNTRVYALRRKFFCESGCDPVFIRTGNALNPAMSYRLIVNRLHDDWPGIKPIAKTTAYLQAATGATRDQG